MNKSNTLYINIHGHRQANNIQEWVMTNLFAQDYPPEDVETGNYSVGFHPYHVGKIDEEDAMNKVRLATENLKVFAIGEIGLDKTIDAPLDLQMRLFEAQVEVAEFAELPVILHIVRGFNEIIEFKRAHRPVVPMIIHGFNGNPQIADSLVKEGFMVSFGEAIDGDNNKIKESLKLVPVENLFLETDEGDLDIREIYKITAGIKEIPDETLRTQIYENALKTMHRLGD